jgi:hypothetical protein
MRWVGRLTVPAAVVAAAFAVGPGPASGATRSCANTYGGDVISATNVGCRKARDVVRTWAVRYRRDGRINRRVLGYRCRGTSDSIEGLTIRCRRGRARIRFYANVPR